MKELAIIVKADVQGSLGVIVESIQKLETEEIRVTVIHSGIGGINESDITLASASRAIKRWTTKFEDKYLPQLGNAGYAWKELKAQFNQYHWKDDDHKKRVLNEIRRRLRQAMPPMLPHDLQG